MIKIVIVMIRTGDVARLLLLQPSEAALHPNHDGYEPSTTY